jgi:hypothetical protein
MTKGIRIWASLVVLCLANIAVLGQTTIINDQVSIPHWYTASAAFDLNPDDDWFPLPDIDVPYSLPLRGYNSLSRNYFMDLGALDWFSDTEWISLHMRKASMKHTLAINSSFSSN